MEPIRKSDGYTLDGIKKYKRYFLINKNTVNKTKKIEFNNSENYDIHNIL
jgi:hypothetical protein